MSEERNEGAAPQAKGGGMGKLIALVVVLLLAVGGGFGVYKFVLQPKLGDEKEGKEEKHEEEGDKIPETAKNAPFDDFMVTVLPAEKSKPAPLLLFSMSLLCSNEECSKLVEKDKDYFKEMLLKLHSYKNREELDDPLIQETIKKDALRLANERLRKLQMKPNEEFKILDVFHTKWTVVDTQ